MATTKLVLTALFYTLGIPVCILNVLLNIGTWKADVVFYISAAILLVKFIHIIITSYQQFQKRQMDLEDQRFELTKKKNYKKEKNE